MRRMLAVTILGPRGRRRPAGPRRRSGPSRTRAPPPRPLRACRPPRRPHRCRRRRTTSRRRSPTTAPAATTSRPTAAAWWCRRRPRCRAATSAGRWWPTPRSSRSIRSPASPGSGPPTPSPSRGWPCVDVDADAHRTRGIIVTNNIWSGVRTVFNVHVFDTGAYQPLVRAGFVLLRQAIGPDAAHPRPLPWRMCAWVVGPGSTSRSGPPAPHPPSPRGTTRRSSVDRGPSVGRVRRSTRHLHRPPARRRAHRLQRSRHDAATGTHPRAPSASRADGRGYWR